MRAATLSLEAAGDGCPLNFGESATVAERRDGVPCSRSGMEGRDLKRVRGEMLVRGPTERDDGVTGREGPFRIGVVFEGAGLKVISANCANSES